MSPFSLLNTDIINEKQNKSQIRIEYLSFINIENFNFSFSSYKIFEYHNLNL